MTIISPPPLLLHPSPSPSILVLWLLLLILLWLIRSTKVIIIFFFLIYFVAKYPVAIHAVTSINHFQFTTFSLQSRACSSGSTLICIIIRVKKSVFLTFFDFLTLNPSFTLGGLREVDEISASILSTITSTTGGSKEGMVLCRSLCSPHLRMPR